MERRDKVRWLFRYRDALRRERELEQELEALRTAACRVTPLLTGMPGGGGAGGKIPRAVESLVQTQQELADQLERCRTVRQEVAAVIGTVPAGRAHEVLRRRYLLGQRFEQIAHEMHLEQRWVYRLHARAVDGLTIPEPRV